MNYELAKELKEAGFPQEGEKFWYVEHSFPEVKKPEKYNEKHWKSIQYSVMTERVAEKQWGKVDKLAYAPTLSELIEACGGKIFGLQRNDKGWSAWAKFPDAEETPEQYGVTPEEAVANLYLALNKK